MIIVATVGPNIKAKSVLREIIEEGVGVLRFNFSHGDINDFNKILENAREIKKDIHIMQDLSGRKIRVSKKLQYIFKLYNNEEVLFCGYDKYINTKISLCSRKMIPLNITLEELLKGHFNEISMKDGSIRFKVISKNDYGIVGKVIKGGIVRADKGCNIRNFNRINLGLSTKDKEDIMWAIDKKADIICQSYVESKKDMEEVKNHFESINLDENYNPEFWAKIENKQGVRNISEILNVCDGIIIGRGDLIPEVSLLETPIYEEKIIKKTLMNKKKVIVATHILDSMKNGRSPEISEVEAIYNYINKGVHGFMFAGETSVGRAPIKTVKFIKKAVTYYEK